MGNGRVRPRVQHPRPEHRARAPEGLDQDGSTQEAEHGEQHPVIAAGPMDPEEREGGGEALKQGAADEEGKEPLPGWPRLPLLLLPFLLCSARGLGLGLACYRGEWRW